ncbi:MAG: FkbM family methyltransferase [Polyangiales bacterium]
MNRWFHRLETLRAHPRPIRFVLGRVLWATGLSERFTVETPRGFRMRFYPSSISAALWSDPTSRREDEDFVWAVLRPGDRYVDAGANVGQLAIAASLRIGPEAEAVAIEAHPDVHGYLEGNLALNGVTNVRAVHCALGEEPGEIAMTSRRSDDQNYVTAVGEVRVPMKPLDSLIEPSPIRLLKLDVEGYELPVLRGATDTLTQTDVVYCELSASNCARFEYAPEEVETLLLEAGFVFLRWTNGFPVISDAAYFSSLPTEQIPATGYNLVAVRPSVTDEVIGRLRDARWVPG